MSRLLLIIVALVGFGTTRAQVTPGTPPPPILISDECLLNTNEEEWTALGLTTAQVEQVQAIQTRCKTDCVALKESGGEDPDPAAGQALLEKHREMIRKVITKEQYDKWQLWCSERDARGSLR